MRFVRRETGRRTTGSDRSGGYRKNAASLKYLSQPRWESGWRGTDVTRIHPRAQQAAKKPRCARRLFPSSLTSGQYDSAQKPRDEEQGHGSPLTPGDPRHGKPLARTSSYLIGPLVRRDHPSPSAKRASVADHVTRGAARDGLR